MLTSLHSLSLRLSGPESAAGQSVNALSGIEALSNLQRLTLESKNMDIRWWLPSELLQLTGLTHLALKRMSLANCNEVLSALCPQLKRLRLKCIAPGMLGMHLPLARMGKLTELIMRYTGVLTRVEGLDALTRLQLLEARGRGVHSLHPSSSQDLTCCSQAFRLTQLTCLTLGSSEALVDLDVLRWHTRLRALWLGDIRVLASMADGSVSLPESLYDLQSLTLYRNFLPHPPSNLSCLTSLTELNFSSQSVHMSLQQDPAFLLDLPHLQRLDFRARNSWDVKSSQKLEDLRDLFQARASSVGSLVEFVFKF